MKKHYVAPKIEIYQILIEECLANTSNIRIQQSADSGWLEAWEENTVNLEYEFENNL